MGEEGRSAYVFVCHFRQAYSGRVVQVLWLNRRARCEVALAEAVEEWYMIVMEFAADREAL